MKTKLTFLITIGLIFSLGLSGCGLLGTAPTADPAAQEATINAAVTLAMQTVQANFTSTAAALPAITNTPENTPEPTATTTLEPTATAIPPTATMTPWPTKPKPTNTATPTPAAYTCKLLSTSPTAGTKITFNGDFDAVWKVQNTGTKAWEVGYLDLKYVSGQKMQTGADIYDINTFVDKGKELTLIVDMKAPGTAGKYTASWVLMMEGITLCTLPVDIEAVAP